jgi:putative ABC transport system permease protein
MLTLKGITKHYKVAGGTVEALKGLDVSFRKSEFVSILGPSGCGKTTTLNIVGGLDKYTSGDLIIAGKSTKNFTDRDWDIYRNHRIGFIFQSYNLIPHQTVLGNVELALTISGVSKEERVKRALNALERVGLKGEEYKRPNQLSGGQCQRVAIARALALKPKVLCFDEPTSALDPELTGEVLKVIKSLKDEDRTMIIVTHEMGFARHVSDKVIFMADGVVEEFGPASILDNPKSEHLKAFLSNVSEKEQL